MKASVIIAALNEAQTIADVVRAARRAAHVSEVIVVSDGSRDGTGAVARQAGAEVVELTRNVGKAGAVMSGVERATGDAIVLLDADLIGLRPEHVDSLLRPVVKDGADMTIGVFNKDLMQTVLPSLCGQRAIRRALLLRHPELSDRGFGLERTLGAIARRERWRVRAVDLPGVSHRRKVEKYGLVGGYRAKLRADADLLKHTVNSVAEHIVVHNPRIRRRMNRRTAAVVVVVLLMVHGISGLFIAQTSAGYLDTMPVPTAQERILLVVAHSDDELIAAGGYLATAREAGSELTVVILTNGDGNKFSAAILARRIRPRPDAFIREGQIRQNESVAALGHLDIAPSGIIFMGFPDRGLSSLLVPHWSKTLPYTSPFTQASKPPYSHVYRAATRYTGEDLVDNLAEIVARVRPTMLLTHSDLDEHPDHKAAHTFVSLALQRASRGGFITPPRRYAFVIHAADFPRPLRYAPNALLSPPTRLRDQARWLTFHLPPTLVARKHDAVRTYRSQYQSPYLRLLLSSFIRRNELFIEEPISNAP